MYSNGGGQEHNFTLSGMCAAAFEIRRRCNAQCTSGNGDPITVMLQYYFVCEKPCACASLVVAIFVIVAVHLVI